MSNEREDIISRRVFAKAAGAAAAVVASVGTAAAQPERAIKIHPRNLKLRRSGLSKLSNHLYNSPAERKAFLANPNAYLGRRGVQGVGRADINQIKNMLADGFCCAGCGCSGMMAPGEEIQR